MNKDPAFLFYSSDFLVGTLLMNYEEIGKYIKLLAYIHSKGGTISTKEFFQVCSEYDTEVINKFSVDGEGNYYNERLLSEMRKRKDYTESRRNNLKGSKKDKNSDDMGIHMEAHMDNHMDTHMENENINSISINSLSLKTNKNKDKTKYGEFENVALSEEEYQKISDLNLLEYIERLSSYLAQTGKRYKSHYATILNWSRKDEPKVIKKKVDIMDL